MRQVLILVLITVILLAISVYIWLTLVVSRIIIDVTVPDITGLSLVDFNLKDLIDRGSTDITIKVTTTIVNTNSFTLNFANPYIIIYYQGQEIARSSDTVKDYKQKVIVGSGSKIQFTESVQVKVNDTSIKVLQMIKSGVRTKLDYDISMNILGFTMGFKSSSIINITN